jgi:ACT domain-containing protein
MSQNTERAHAHTIRLELVDEPGELLRALEPIADNGGNLLSIFHERGSVTPRGHIPVEIDVEATPERFDDIVAGLREAGINVVQAGAERYSESITLIVSGHLVDTGLSDTLTRIREESNTSITELSLSAPEGTRDVSSARLKVSTAMGEVERTMEVIRDIAEDKDLRLIEPHDVAGVDG